MYYELNTKSKNLQKQSEFDVEGIVLIYLEKNQQKKFNGFVQYKVLTHWLIFIDMSFYKLFSYCITDLIICIIITVYVFNYPVLFSGNVRT